jgi:hypothetical protein
MTQVEGTILLCNQVGVQPILACLPKTTLLDFGQARTLLFLWARTDIICREEPEKRSGALELQGAYPTVNR